VAGSWRSARIYFTADNIFMDLAERYFNTYV